MHKPEDRDEATDPREKLGVGFGRQPILVHSLLPIPVPTDREHAFVTEHALDTVCTPPPPGTNSPSLGASAVPAPGINSRARTHSHMFFGNAHRHKGSTGRTPGAPG